MSFRHVFLLCPRQRVRSIVMSVSVCLSVREDISGTIRAIFTNFVHVAYGRGSVLRRQCDEIPRGRGNFGVFFPTDNALYSIAFGIHTKTAESIDMPFGMVSGLGSRKNVLRGVTISKGKGAILSENMYPTSLTPLIIANWTGRYSETQLRQTLDCKHWTSLLSAAKSGVGLHTACEV